MSLTSLIGKMSLRYRTKGTMDFNNFNYVVVFNTCNQGGEPYPNALGTTFTNYSYSFAIGAGAGVSTVTPVLYQYVLIPGSQSQLNPQRVSLNPATTTLVLNSNGQNTEFNLTFPLTQLFNPLAVPTPCPNGAVPATSWYVNYLTIDSQGRVQDSLGQFAATDTSYSLLLDTTMSHQTPVIRPAGINGLPSNTAAQIDGGEIDNFCPCPTPGPSVSPSPLPTRLPFRVGVQRGDRQIGSFL